VAGFEALLGQVNMSCLICGAARKGGAKKFCSSQCYGKAKIGTKNWWGYKIGDALRGKPKSPEHIRNAAAALRGRERLDMRGELSPWWKGDAITYGGLHDWIRLRKGLAKVCEVCGKVGFKSKGHWNVHWANISGLYKRDLDDWAGLCRSCHYWFDKCSSK
jgi:hypothetical protein